MPSATLAEQPCGDPEEDHGNLGDIGGESVGAPGETLWAHEGSVHSAVDGAGGVRSDAARCRVAIDAC